MIVTRIYLDMCCYNRPYDDQSLFQVAMETQAKLYIQHLIREGRFELVGSFMLDFERSRNPFEMRKTAIDGFIKENMKLYVGPECYHILRPKILEIMNRGMRCLVEQMGWLDAEQFIAALSREKFDYTKWQREYFDAMKPGEFYKQALNYAEAYPYTGKAKKL